MRCSVLPVLRIVWLCILPFYVFCDVNDNEVDECVLPDKLKDEIKGYQPIVNRIIKTVLDGPHKHTTYDRLAEFIDTFGNRIAGSKNLENAIDYMLNKSQILGLENVRGENVSVPRWIR